MGSPKFERLIRFASPSGQVHYGEVPKNHPWDKDLTGIEVQLYDGESPWDDNLSFNGKTARVKDVLNPLVNVPIIYGIGLNYKEHAEEAKAAIPKYPRTFVKFPDAMAGPYEDITVHPTAEDLDYEGELVFVVGKDVKNLPAGVNALEYVSAYTVGNDLSSRFWQDPNRGGSQSHYAKSFDKFAPMGPVLVSSKVIPDPTKLTLRTYVNGEKRQDAGVDDLIFDISHIIHYLSQGRTLRKGAVVMTGTPSGVGSLMPGGPKFLRHGDVVEVEIGQIGKIRNRMIFE